jgi:DNA-binding protein YbaB
MVPALRQNINELQKSLEVATVVYSELREVLVKSSHNDAHVVINGLQKVKAVYSEEKFPLDAYKDIFLNIVDAANIVLDFATVEAGRRLALSEENNIQIHEKDRYAARQGRVTVLFDGKSEFVSISVEGESEMDDFLVDVVIALNNALKTSLTEATKKLADIASRS